MENVVKNVGIDTVAFGVNKTILGFVSNQINSNLVHYVDALDLVNFVVADVVAEMGKKYITEMASFGYASEGFAGNPLNQQIVKIGAISLVSSLLALFEGKKHRILGNIITIAATVPVAEYAKTKIIEIKK